MSLIFIIFLTRLLDLLDFPPFLVKTQLVPVKFSRKDKIDLELSNYLIYIQND